jgi:hypothetical protein
VSTSVEEKVTDAVLDAALSKEHQPLRKVARWARRKKLLDKVRDAEIEALRALCHAFHQDDGEPYDELTDAVVDRMSENSTYEKMEMLCIEVLELRKRLRRLGWDNNWEPAEEPEQERTE